MLHEIYNIVVGVGPFTEPQSHLVDILGALAWFKNDGVRVQIVSVVNPDDLGWSKNLENERWIDEIEEKAYGDLKAKLHTPHSNQSFEFHILVQREASKSKTVLQFLEFASQIDADIVVVHSHTKSFFKSSLGSFCNKLVHHSTLPVLVLPFGESVSSSLRAILYPTDFSGLSEIAFKSVVKWCDSIHAHLTLYHRIARPIDEILQVALHPIESKTVSPEDIVLISEEEVVKKGREWTYGVASVTRKISFKMDSDKMTLPEAILAQAEKQNIDLIVMPSHTSHRNIPSIGSAVDHVLRRK